jgi:hypothetical protein
MAVMNEPGVVRGDRNVSQDRGSRRLRAYARSRIVGCKIENAEDA